MATVKHLFLDLEDTVITPVVDGWHNAELINIAKVRSFMDAFQPDHLHLFSFALHDDKDKQGFDQHLRPALERELGRRIEMAPLVFSTILPACCAIKRLHPQRVDFSDMSEFWSKHESFRLFVQHQFNKPLWNQAVEVALLDDAVLDEDFAWPTLNIRGMLRNIDNLP